MERFGRMLFDATEAFRMNQDEVYELPKKKVIVYWTRLQASVFSLVVDFPPKQCGDVQHRDWLTDKPFERPILP